jgi:hypothetical protein
MVAEKHDDLWQNNQLYINMLHRYIDSGYPQILLTGHILVVFAVYIPVGFSRQFHRFSAVFSAML